MRANWRHLGLGLFSMVVFLCSGASAVKSEPAACLSPNPADWPTPAKPYFLVIADTSDSMSTALPTDNACGYAKTRTGHLACALKTSFQNLAGYAHFGLMTFAVKPSSCSGQCYLNCAFSGFAGEDTGPGCGPESTPINADSTTRHGGNLVVPISAQSEAPSNLAELLAWTDGSCASSKELFSSGASPVNGALRDAYRYFGSQWTSPDGSPTFVTPLGTTSDLACRRVNVILILDGTENCDTWTNAVDAAADLFAGVTVGGTQRSVKVHVVRIGTALPLTDANSLASAGGSSAAYSVATDAEIQATINSIVLDQIGKAEACDNADNNCNGCTDEGYRHFGNVQSGAGNCCTWGTPVQRQTCMTNYLASITVSKPKGDQKLLPCVSAAQAVDPLAWLCYDPGEVCDNIDNNLQDGVDEGMLKCGNPAHCPTAEICDGQDNNCNGIIDEGGSCPTCIASAEICDGCDNDCDGVADNGVASLPCGLTNPPNCQGVMSCKPSQAVAQVGGCIFNGGGWNACSNNPQSETCDSVDNDCDGIVDDGTAPVGCVPAGSPPGLVYGGTSQCKMGTKACGSSICAGFVGPSSEVCDGIDNNCNGQVDENTFGVGIPCGLNQAPCAPGTMACVNGALVCQGGIGPKAEVCDGIDNDCDGVVDDAPLSDGPPAGMNGCWTQPGNCCNFSNAQWCPPPGATCNDVGMLAPPCSKGTLVCMGSWGWACRGSKEPAAEKCNGLDDDCSGVADDGMLPGTGSPCGTNIGECQSGTTQCMSGKLACDWGNPPAAESCDGTDNDCDGRIDNLDKNTQPCPGDYDSIAYPGYRVQGRCTLGMYVCIPGSGVLCIGAITPEPEICDGFDNDCDGLVDELGAAPDGIEGSQVEGQDGVIGGQCFSSLGACPDSYWSCTAGKPYCHVASKGEVCDGLDNDCDGVADEEPAPGEPILCAAGSSCVRYEEVVRCSQPCTQAAQPCPGGQVCVEVVASSDGSVLPKGCLPRTLVEAAVTEPLAPATALSAPVMPQSLVHKATSVTQIPAPAQGARMLPNREVLVPAAQSDSDEATLPYPTAATETQEASLEAKSPVQAESPVQAAEEGTEAGGGCVAGNTSTSGSSALVLMALLGLLLHQLRRRSALDRKGGAMVALLLVTALSSASCTVETSVGPTADLQDSNTGDTAQDGILPDGAPSDVQKPKDQMDDGEVPDSLNDLLGDVDLISNDADADPGDATTCGDADLKSPSTCGSCDHNCADEVPPNTDGNAAVCQWEVGSQEPGVCLFPVCLPGWANPDPTVPGCEFFCTSTQTPETECNNVDDDCDHLVDEDVDGCAIATCGGCDGMNCATEFTDTVTCETSTASCLDALCAIKTCQTGHVDLNGKAEDGCEYPCDGVLEAEESCDGLDDDCNGDVDEVFDFHSPFHCGGCNVNCYEAAPNADVDGVSCFWSGTPGEPGVCAFTTCAPNYHDLDGTAPGCETYCVKQGETDASCDSIDDDCDGQMDEDVDYCAVDHCGNCSTSCEGGLNVAIVECVPTQLEGCSAGAQCGIVKCAEGYVDLDKEFATGCEYPCVYTGPEMCNGLDDDCNGVADDDLTADPALGVPCYGGTMGLCASPEHSGVMTCILGNVECLGDNLLVPGQLPELCNGQDDDCDGVTDQNPMDVGTTCGSSNIFPCSFGTYQCQNGAKVCVGAVDGVPETCNGIDDDCDGLIDLSGDVPPPEATGACNVPVPPPPGATTPCQSGQKACQGGQVKCLGSVGPTSSDDSCGVDSNCDGQLTNQPDLMTDVTNCGTCGNNCYTGAVHAIKTCVWGSCISMGCEAGYYDLDGNGTCEYACIFTSAQESCNGWDDNCNGMIDEGVIAPTPAQVCGVSPSATSPECTTQVQVACQFGAWKCTFGSNICAPNCATATEICDNYDNNCNGLKNENVANWGKPCSSDDGLPSPGHGACRTTGTYVCNGNNAVTCNAVKADCNSLPGGCTELCDGVDNDCDGSVDEPFSAKGTNSVNFVKPVVTKIGSSLWIYSYEASRPNATSLAPGFGNGYFTSAPVGTTYDKTPSCSAANKTPWFNVTPAEASQVCTAMGGRLCTTADWTQACQASATPVCTWGYNPRGTACTTTYNGSKYCNLAPGFDFSPGVAGDQDGLLATASSLLQNCWADWSALLGNTATSNKIYDMTGNLGEWASISSSSYAVMGGSYLTESVDAAQCANTTLTGASNNSGAGFGFRCCFTADPTL